MTCPETHKVKQGLSREDLFTVVHDPLLTDTAQYADIVLPATTYLETSDFYRGYGTYCMQCAAGRRAAPGRGVVQHRLAQALAQRMGLTDEIFSLTPQQILPKFFEGAKGAVARIDPAKLLDHRADQGCARGRRAGVPDASQASSRSIPASLRRRACRRCPIWRARSGRGAATPPAGRCAC